MATALIINPGSSSKKYALFKDGMAALVLRFEQTGSGFAVTSEYGPTKGECSDISAVDFQSALSLVIERAQAEHLIMQPGDVDVVGVRIVAPASYFTEHRLIDEGYVKHLRSLQVIDPVHIPAMLAEIGEVEQIMPKVRCVGVSDSAFHSTAHAIEQAVSLPTDDIERFDLHKFGYHGISVASVVKHVAIKDGQVPARMVVCHIGSGVSVTAVRDGKSIANSMGYSPASGVMMSSRMGDVPADMLVAVMTRKGLKGKAIYDYLYQEGGFKGVTGVRDLRLVIDRAEKQDCEAQKALAMFGHQIRSYIARYAMLMEGLDMIVLTATAAERNPAVRSLLVGQLPLFSTYVHNERNESLVGCEGYIHTDESRVKILVIKTDELGEMYRVVQQFV